MNLLAHAYLSFNNTNVLVGNMISDYVKGKTQYNYPIPIQQGIQLHRAIDEFTDTHAVTIKLKQLFKPTYRLYAGAFVDVVYDYFLANDKNEFANSLVLKEFTQSTYKSLEKNIVHFPEKFAKTFTYMQLQDWLYNYKTTTGMQKSFNGLARRATYITETDTAFQIFLAEMDYIENEYKQFFPELKLFAYNKLAILLVQ
ncbi:MAG: ACP phosphodiesterase [Ferruginibacter sp.]|nr:DUF479 domain-containing protein [Ferruginibacter sp.]